MQQNHWRDESEIMHVKSIGINHGNDDTFLKGNERLHLNENTCWGGRCKM